MNDRLPSYLLELRTHVFYMFLRFQATLPLAQAGVTALRSAVGKEAPRLAFCQPTGRLPASGRTARLARPPADSLDQPANTLASCSTLQGG